MAPSPAPAPPKGILKKPTSAFPVRPPRPPGQDAAAADDDDEDDFSDEDNTLLPRRAQALIAQTKSQTKLPRSREDAERIARQHATILQHRKDTEAAIFAAILELVDFPQPQHRQPPFSAASPAPPDAARFRQLVRLFQPGDYDDLIEERNIAGVCGYALCPTPCRRFLDKDGKPAGEFKLLHKNTKDFAIVRRADLEKWCSDECARRALYVKVQLNEAAAWERVGLPDLQVELLDEEDQVAPLSQAVQNESSSKAAKDAADLALERGDVGLASGRQMSIPIREKAAIVTSVPPSKTSAGHGEDDQHLMVEGFKTMAVSTASGTAPRGGLSPQPDQK